MMNNINLILYGHDLYYDVFTIVQIFYPNTKVCNCSDISGVGVSIISRSEESCVTTSFYNDSVLVLSNSLPCTPKTLSRYDLKDKLKLSAYELLQAITGISSSWGIMTGIRPSKRVFEFRKKGYNDSELQDIFRNTYKVSKGKIDLMFDVAAAEEQFLTNHVDKKSLYISIPFCPTTCIYCSFGSTPIRKFKDKLQLYMTALIKELDFIKGIQNEFDTIYIGGGTPTSLNDYQLELLMDYIVNNFRYLREFTVEAGRPDTLNTAKLDILKKSNVTRISINPQTMNEDTLKLIKRNHTPKDIVDAFYMAREAGHNNINMDTILGLPSETEKSVEQTFLKISELKPESVTVHTLAIKRASELKDIACDPNIIENMLDISKSYTNAMGMKPYYMYRQKNMMGNFENVGYSLADKQCLYNIFIMEEVQTIIGAGAGAITKIVDDSKIERIFNVKSIEEYISRIDEMIERKLIL